MIRDMQPDLRAETSEGGAEGAAAVLLQRAQEIAEQLQREAAEEAELRDRLKSERKERRRGGALR
jgi:hypothetical protein